MAKKERKGIWIPQSIMALDLNGNDKILLAEIYSLCEREDGCYASNNHFMKLLGYKTPGAASKRISFLSDKGYIRTEDVFEKRRCVGRIIYRSQKTEILKGEIPNNTHGIDNRNKEVVPNEPEGISVGNTINSFINSSLINSDTSTNTGENLVEINFQIKELPEHLQPSTTTGFKFFRKQSEEAAAILLDATSIGAEIFEYARPDKFPVLEKLIGTSDFLRVKPELLKFINANKNLN